MLKRLLILPAVLIALLVGGVVGLILLFRPPAPARPLPDPSFEISGVTMINPGLDRSENVNLRVREGRLELETNPNEKNGTEMESFQGHFVLPGLVDMHSHLPPRNLLNTTGQYGALYLLHGVTAIRDAGDVDGTAIGAAHEAIEAGVPMPRVFSAGPFITTGPSRWPNSVFLDSPGDADEIVRRIKAEGHTWLKFYENLTMPMIRALEKAADDQGMGVLGHVPDNLAYEEALIRDVQHFLGIPKPETLLSDSIPNRIGDWDSVDEARMDEIVRVTTEHGIINTPTLALSRGLLRYRDYESTLRDPLIDLLPPFYPEVVWSPEIGIPVYRTLDEAYLDRLDRAFAKKKTLLKKLYDTGATLRLGTDQQQPFTVPGASLQEEMRIFVDAGIPLEQVWTMATRDAGAVLGVEHLGELKSGAPADFLIFREDPTRDLEALSTLTAVVSRGRLFTVEELRASVDRWKVHWKQPVRHAFSNAVVKRAVARIAGDFDQ